MSDINRHSHKDKERDNASTGFVQDEHRSISTTGGKGPSNKDGPSKVVVGIYQQAGTWNET
eukprot:2941479-Prorocentrum_lima.AAC.1